MSLTIVLSNQKGGVGKTTSAYVLSTALKEKGYKIYLLSNYSEELLHVHTKGAKVLNVLDGGVVS